jgi:hypothetical protein
MDSHRGVDSRAPGCTRRRKLTVLHLDRYIVFTQPEAHIGLNAPPSTWLCGFRCEGIPYRLASWKPARNEVHIGHVGIVVRPAMWVTSAFPTGPLPAENAFETPSVTPSTCRLHNVTVLRQAIVFSGLPVFCIHKMICWCSLHISISA